MRQQVKRCLTACFLGLLSGVIFAQTPAFTLEISGNYQRESTLTLDLPFEEYRVRVAEGGTLDVLMANAPESALDSKLYLVNARDEIILQNDDCEGDRTRSCLTLTNMTAGEYRVIATRYSDKKLGDYILIITLNDTSPTPYTIDASDEALTLIGYPVITDEASTAWTIFAYYGGDTDLERAIIEDLEEFEIAGGSNENVRVVAFLDRSIAEFVSPSPEQEWAGARVYKITAGSTPIKDRLLESEPLFEIDSNVDTNSGDGETLAQFLTWGIRTYPSERYAVAFAGHGEGWAGLIPDFSQKRGSRYAMITVPELTQAFEVAQTELQKRGLEQFELVINDACLMSSIEYHNATLRFFKYSIASPEIVLNPALDMGLLLTLLTENPLLPIPEVGEALVNAYIDVDMENFPSSDKNHMASAIIDLGRIEAVNEALEAFAGVVNENPQAYVTTLGVARKNTYTYASWNKIDQHIDISDLMRQVTLNSNDPVLIEAAQAVVRAVDDAVLYGKARSKVPSPSYMNVYFPSTAKSFANRYYVETPLPQWAQMLRNYYAAVDPQVWNREGRFFFHEPIEPTVSISQTSPSSDDVVTTQTGLTLAIEAKGRKIARGWLTIDQAQTLTDENGNQTEGYVRLGVLPSLRLVPSEEGQRYESDFTPGVSFIQETWNGYLYTISDGETEGYELLESTSSLDTAVLEGRYRVSEADEWKDGAVIFGELDYNEDYTLKFRNGQSVISRDGANSGIGSVLLPAGAQFQAYKSVVTEDGSVQRELGTVYIWGEDGLNAVETPAPNGQFRVTYLMEAFGSQLGFDSVLVNVDNSDIDPVQRAYIDPENGYIWQYDPTIWYDPTLNEQGFVDATYGEDLAYVEVYTFDETIRYEPSPYGAILQYADVINLFYEFVDNGLEWEGEALWQFEGGDAFGNSYTGFAIQALPNKFAVFGVYTTEEESEELYDLRFEVVQDILANLRVFSPDFVDEDASEWALQNVSYSFQVGKMPLLKSWREFSYDYGSWSGFASDNSFHESLNWVRVAQWAGADARTVLDSLIDGEVANGYDTTSYEAIDNDKPIYYGENYVWDVVFYRRERNGVPVIGRMYATRSTLGNIYTAWFETPETADDSDDQQFSQVFELMLDGFIVPNPIRTFIEETTQLSLSYPKSWYGMSYVEELKSYVAFNPNLVTRLALYLVEWALPEGCNPDQTPLSAQCEPDEEKLIETIESQTGLTLQLSGNEIVVGALSLPEVAYVPNRDSQTGIGVGVVFYVGDVGVMVAFENDNGVYDEVAPLLFNLDGWLVLPQKSTQQAAEGGGYGNDTRLHREPTFGMYLMETWTDIKTEVGLVTYNGNQEILATVKNASSPSGQTLIAFVYVSPEDWLGAGIQRLQDFTLGKWDESVAVNTRLLGAQYDANGDVFWEGRLAYEYNFYDEATQLSGRALMTFSPETYEIITMVIYGEPTRGELDYFHEVLLADDESILMFYANDYDPENLSLGASYGFAVDLELGEEVLENGFLSVVDLPLATPTGWQTYNNPATGAYIQDSPDGVYLVTNAYYYEENALPIDVAFKVAFDEKVLLGQGIELEIYDKPALLIHAFDNQRGAQRSLGYLLVQLLDGFALVTYAGAYDPAISPQVLETALACFVQGQGADGVACDWQAVTDFIEPSNWADIDILGISKENFSYLYEGSIYEGFFDPSVFYEVLGGQ